MYSRKEFSSWSMTFLFEDKLGKKVNSSNGPQGNIKLNHTEIPTPSKLM